MQKVEVYLTKDKIGKLTGYLFEKQNEFPKRAQWTPEKRPAILILPGGSYLYCSDREGDPVAVTFSQKGYQTFILEYSTGEASDYPTPLIEVAKAIDHIKKNAEEYLVDIERITLAGLSAGGHLALVYGSSFMRKEFQELTKMTKDEMKIESLIAAYPVANFKALYDRAVEYSKNSKSNKEIPIGKMFGIYEERRDPIALIDPEMPRTFIFTTLKDRIIPPVDTVEYVRRLMEKGIDIEFHLFNKGSHGLSTGDDLSNYSRDYPKRIGEWILLAENWLKDEGPSVG